MVPDNTSVPPFRIKLPLPDSVPEKMPEALVRFNECTPRLTAPVPDSEANVTLVPAAAERSSVPLMASELAGAKLPVPEIASVPA